MNTKLAAVALVSATMVAFPAFAEGEASTTTTTTATATAAPAEGGEKGGEKEFGNPGTIGIGGAINFGTLAIGSETAGKEVDTRAPTGLELSFGSSKPKEGESTSHFNFSLAPTIDYFVAEGISVGAQLGFTMANQKTGDNKVNVLAFGIGPRVGYNLWLTPEKLSLYPQVTFSYVNVSSKVNDNDGPSANKMNVRLFVPVLIHPAKHFHFGIGPFFAMDIASKTKPVATADAVDGSKDTIFGISGEIAGWL